MVKMSSYEIKERLSEKQLHQGIFNLNKEYCGHIYRHTNGGEYYIYGSTIINECGSAWWGLLYHPIDEEGNVDRNIFYARPLHEFLDGRFTKSTTSLSSTELERERLNTFIDRFNDIGTIPFTG